MGRWAGSVGGTWKKSWPGIGGERGRVGSDTSSGGWYEVALLVAAAACLAPFLFDALGHPPPLAHECLALVAAVLLGVSSAACTRLPPSASVLANLRLPACA